MVTEGAARRQDEPWFSGKPGTVLLYRINRRPLAQQSLFGEEPPANIIDHVAQVLLFGQEVETGRRNKRYWRLGNKRIDDTDRLLMGQVGWEATSTEAADKYDADRKEWIDAVDERGRTARAPFVFDRETRILAILKHPSFSETTLPVVFRTLLQQGEAARETSTTDWDVEPIGDTETFREWLRSVDAVERVQFVAKMPNPDGLDEFGPVWERMEQHKARLLKEVMEAADHDIGLVDLEGDRVVNGFLAMSENAFGYVTANGSRDGRPTSFDQRAAVARRQTDPLPPSWPEVFGIVIDLVREWRRQRGT